MRTLLALACGLGVASAGPASVIGWSTVSGTFKTETVFRGGVSVVPTALFKAIELPTSGASVVFVQDGVQVDDFARFGGIYGESTSAIANIKTAIEGASSSAFVPTVSALDRYTINKHFPSAIEVDAKDFAEKRITISSSNYTTIVVNLPSLVGSKNVAAGLESNDKLIGSITSELKRSGAPLCVMVVSISDEEFGAATPFRTRRDVASAESISGSSIAHQCTSAACRYPRNVGKPTFIMFFSSTVLMGIVVCGLMVLVFLTGTFGLMVLAVNDGKFPDPAKQGELIVSTRNE